MIFDILSRMKTIVVIEEHEVFPDRPKKSASSYKKLRKAVRVIIFDKNKRLALNHRPAQYGFPEQHSIPGGGIEEKETAEEALARETLEETGCKLERITEIGKIVEYGAGPDLIQEIYCYLGAVNGSKGEPQFSDEEVQSNLSVVWLSLSEAKRAIEATGDCFAKRRSILLLNEIKER